MSGDQALGEGLLKVVQGVAVDDLAERGGLGQGARALAGDRMATGAGDSGDPLTANRGLVGDVRRRRRGGRLDRKSVV